MELQLDSNYKITVDSSRQNFQLEALQPIKDKSSGEIVRHEYKIIGYFGHNLGSVLRRYKDEVIINSDNLDVIDNVLDKLKELENTIDRVVKKQNIKMAAKSDD